MLTPSPRPGALGLLFRALTMTYWFVPCASLVVAASWWIEGGSGAVLRAAPLLVLTFLTGQVGTVFARQARSTYWMLPRRLRLQLGLEFGLFWWNELRDLPGRDSQPLVHLEVARRAAADPALHDRIVRIIAAVSSGGGREKEQVADELRACIRLSATRTPAPYRTRRLLPEHRLFPLTLVLAGIAVIATGRGTPGLDDVPPALTFLLLASVSLRSFSFVEEKLRAVRKRQAFRVLFVTDITPVDPINRAAVLHYSKVGHLIGVFVDTPVALVQVLESEGMDFFTPISDELGNPVEAFVDHADLIVVHSRDETLAARLRAATTLPVTRCLTPSEDTTAPDGFTWLDPMYLRLDPMTRTPTELDPAIVPLFGLIRPVSARASFLPRIVGFPALFLLPEWRLLAALLCLSTAGWLFPELAGVRRRAAHSKTELRAPRSYRTSRRLQPRRLERVLVAITFPATIAAVAVGLGVAPSHLQLTGPQVGLGLLVGASAWIVIYTGLVGGVLFAVKWYLDWSFRIVVFRRNSVRFGYAHKAIVMATCGVYGQVVVLNDSALGETDTNYGEGRESALGVWFQVFSEANHALERAVFLHDWRIQVTAELDHADVAILDWAEEVTDNMRWELQAAIERLPGNRILVVYDPEGQQGVAELVAKVNESTNPPVRAVALARGRDDEYLWPDDSAFRDGFRLALEEVLAPLRTEPRPPRRPVTASSSPLPE